MGRLAYRQLRLEPGRSLLTCVGIAAVVAVILFLEGFREGLYSQLRQVSLDRGAELIATQAGISNMVAARSVIPQMARGQVEDVEGVRLAHPMTALALVYEGAERRTALFLTVTDTLGGPTDIIEGRALEGDREIVIDRSLAQLYGFSVGDDLELAGYPFEIVGITETSAAFWTPLAFTNFDTLIDFYFETKLADDISAFPLLSYLLIELDPGADPDVVSAQIEGAVPDVDIFRPEELAESDAELGETMMGAILTILIGVAYVAGFLVVALFMFTTAEARRKDLGILKALGFSNRAVLGSIVAETGVLTALAIPLGIAIAVAVTAAVHAAMPLYLVLPTLPGPLVRSILACGVFALVGALAPLQLIRNLEPAEVFQ